ncbi:MAG: polysaccharide biosynthesis C-terminal domain-containing protein [Lachnospiraceae bacterium]
MWLFPIFSEQEINPSLSRAVHNAMALSLVGGILLCVGGYFLAPVYLHLVNTPGTLQPMAVSYLRIYLCSLVSMFIYNLGSGVLRAMGDSRSPLYAQAVGGLVNVVMDYLFIRLCSNGINGVAWATLISQTMAAVMVLYFLTRLEPEYRFRLKKLSFDIPILKESSDWNTGRCPVSCNHPFQCDGAVSYQFLWGGLHCCIYGLF